MLERIEKANEFIHRFLSLGIVGVGGSIYLLFTIGVGMAAATWTNFFFAIFLGLFWPLTLIYWLTMTLHNLAESSVLGL